MRRENEDKVLRLEADLTEAKNGADFAEQWLMLIRREIEDHLMPSVTVMRDGPKPTNPAARSRPLTAPTPSRSSASTWFRRLWLRVSATAALGCRAGADMESAIAFDRAPEHEPALSNGLSVRKTGNTAPASEPRAPSGSGGNSVALGSVSDAGTKSGRVELAWPSAGQDEAKRLGRSPIAPELERRIREALNQPGRTEGVRKIVARFGGRSRYGSAHQPPFRRKRRRRR